MEEQEPGTGAAWMGQVVVEVLVVEGQEVEGVLAGFCRPSVPVRIPASFLFPRYSVRCQLLALYWLLSLSFHRDLLCCSVAYGVLRQ